MQGDESDAWQSDNSVSLLWSDCGARSTSFQLQRSGGQDAEQAQFGKENSRAHLLLSLRFRAQRSRGPSANAALVTRANDQVDMMVAGMQRDVVGIPAVSAALGVPRATAYRWQRPAPPVRTGVRCASPRALTASEQTAVLTQRQSARFVDCAPAQVYATLLEEDTYLCSPRTMYRILAAYHQVRERRAQRTHPTYAVPRFIATRPNAVWTWDITERKGPHKGDHYTLYVVLDLYSRYVVALMLASRVINSPCTAIAAVSKRRKIGTRSTKT